MIFIILATIIIYIILIAWTWQSLGTIQKNKKVVFILIEIILINVITLIAFQMAKGGITYESEEMQKSVQNVLVPIFTGINGIIIMPQIGKILDKINEEQIEKRQLVKRVAILLTVFVLCIILEIEYMKDTQEGILKMYNCQRGRTLMAKLPKRTVPSGNIRSGKMEKVIVICGPTASGKTGLSIELAKRIKGEIISSDSMQIYQEMNIGTAKPTLEERQGIKHYLLDFVSPEERYSVADYKRDAKKAIKEIIKKGKTPIVVGGTGLYIDSLIYEIEYPNIEFDEDYRKKLEQRAQIEGLQVLYEEAQKIDPLAIQKISSKDEKRILRVLEIYHATGRTKTEQERESRKKPIQYDYQVYALKWDREILYERINKRVDLMLEQGLIEEVKGILKNHKQFPTAMQGLGYKEVVEFLEGDITKQEMIEKIKMETRRYAKRQMTWFRKNKQTIWLNGQAKVQDNIEIILEGLN